MGISLAVLFILSILYIRSGTTYYSNVGFGGTQITFRIGSFYYDYYSDVGLLGRAIGFTNKKNGEISLSPISFLSSGSDSIAMFTESLIEIECGERHYLVTRNELVNLKSYLETSSDAIRDEIGQPFYIRQGDETKKLGQCSY